MLRKSSLNFTSSVKVCYIIIIFHKTGLSCHEATLQHTLQLNGISFLYHFLKNRTEIKNEHQKTQIRSKISLKVIFDEIRRSLRSSSLHYLLTCVRIWWKHSPRRCCWCCLLLRRSVAAPKTSAPAIRGDDSEPFWGTVENLRLARF